MDSELLKKRLTEASISGDNFQYSLDDITSALPTGNGDIGLVETILRFIEKNPSLDYGDRGALKHYVEKFYRRGYEERLIASIRRRPTPETMGMLVRLINVTTDAADREKLLALAIQVRSTPSVDATTKWLAGICGERESNEGVVS